MRDSLEMILFTVSLNSCSAAAPVSQDLTTSWLTRTQSSGDGSGYSGSMLSLALRNLVLAFCTFAWVAPLFA